MDLIRIENSHIEISLHWTEAVLLTAACHSAADQHVSPFTIDTSRDLTTLENVAALFQAAALAGYMQGASTAEHITFDTLVAKVEGRPADVEAAS